MFYIFDCNNQIIGNPKGYATIKGASRWANTRCMQNLIWSTFDARADKSKTTVWLIHAPGRDVAGQQFSEVAA